MEANNSPVDRISALPDTVIQHILSFLPSSKQSIQTGILSKAWKNQWAHVPDLIFEKRFERRGGLCNEDFIRFIESSLLQYKCLKMKKFHIGYDFGVDTNFESKLHFAITKDVEVLCLDFLRCRYDRYKLPNFIFENASMVELQIAYCDFELISSKVNWPSLKALKMKGCSLGSGLCIENVVSGSPLLKSLEIKDSRDSKSFIHIASKSLKMFTLKRSRVDIEISCPNLEKLSIREMKLEDKTIDNVVSGSPSLHTLELQGYHFGQIVIVSKSLKKVFLSLFRDTEVEICCPNLEEFFLYSCKIENCKLMKLPSSCCVTLGDRTDLPPLKDCPDGCRKILKKLQAFKNLTVGDWFVEILSASTTIQPSYPLLRVQCLTLNYPYFERIVGSVNVLRCSPVLERLVIEFPAYKDTYVDDIHSKLKKIRKAYSRSNVTGFTCLVSHLKNVKIIGLSKRDNRSKFGLLYIEFLLKNAKVLEKMEVILADDETDFLEVKLLSFPRVSKHAIVELYVVT